MEPRYPTARGEQAAYWYLKLQEPDVSAEEIQAALAWQTDPDNYAAFVRVQSFRQAWPTQTAVSSNREASRKLSDRIRRRALVAAALAAIVAAGWLAHALSAH